MPAEPIPVSVLILTRDEEQDLPGCLASVAWCDDVHVFDSCSTDRTVAIARAAGCHVHQRAFDGYASQRNASLAGPFRHGWVLIVDADERVSPALRDELATVAALPDEVGACRVPRHDHFLGRWLRHAQITPLLIRLARVGRLRYEREINEVPVVDGAVHDLSGHLDHFPFSKGLDHWIAKHNAYSRGEARVLVQERHGAAPASWRIALFGRDLTQRRFHQKRLFYRLPCRPLIKALYMLVVRRAFLDGRAGLRYTALQCIYEYLIEAKAAEIAAGAAPTAAATDAPRLEAGAGAG